MATQLSDDEFEQKLNQLGLQSKSMSEMTPTGEEAPLLEAAPVDTSAIKIPDAEASLPAAPVSVSNASLDAMAGEAKRSLAGEQLDLPEVKNPAPVEATQAPKHVDRLQQLLTGEINAETEEDKKMLENYFNQSSKQPNPDTAIKPVDAVSQQDPFEQNPELNDEALKNAQASAGRKAFFTNLGQAGAGLAAGATGQQFDSGFFTELQKQNQQPVEDIKVRRDSLLKGLNAAKIVTDLGTSKLDANRKAQLMDPNSQVSKAIGVIQLQALDVVNKDLADKLRASPEWNALSGQDKKEYIDHMIENVSKLQAQKDVRAERAEAKEVDNKLKQETRNDSWALSAARTITSSQPFKNYQEFKVRQETLENAARNPSAYGDIGSIFAFMKTLDPSSVVRESEYATASGAGSLLTRAQNAVQKAATGKMLAPEQRDDLLRFTKHLGSVYKNNYNDFVKPFKKQGSDRGVDLTSVDPYHSPVDEKQTKSSDEITPDVANYAKSHNMTPEQALAIKKQRTGAK